MVHGFRTGTMGCALAVLAAGCAPAEIPAMHPGTGPAPGPSRGRIVFVRPASPCDTTDHARIVDDEGHFVGFLGSGSWFSLPVAPGERTFAVWPGLDLRSNLRPEFAPIDVVSVSVEAGETVHLGVRLRNEQSHHCAKYAIFRFARPEPGEIEDWMHVTRELVPDAAEGQASLDRDAELTHAYLEMAKRRFGRRRETH
jgi:hypothetical protein